MYMDEKIENLANQRKRQFVHMVWHPFLDMPVVCDTKEDSNYCPKWEKCNNHAGYRTLHPGVGACYIHDSKREQKAGAIVMAHKIAEALDITPWDALLLAVRRAAAWAAFYQTKLSEVDSDDDLRPGGLAYDWVLASERTNGYLVKWSKLCIDAGISRMMVEQAQTQGAEIATILNQAITASGMDSITEMQLRKALREVLESMASKSAISQMPETKQLSASEPYVDPDDRWNDYPDKRWYGGKES